MKYIGLVYIGVCTILVLHSCTNVAPNDSVVWDVNYTVPLLKEKVTVSMLGLSEKNIKDDSARLGDTLYVKRNEQLYQQCKADIFTMPEMSHEWFGGNIVIRKLKLESIVSGKKIRNIPFLSKGTSNAKRQFWRDTVVFSQVKTIEFGNTSEVLRAVVKNQSTTTSISEISYSVISSTDTLVFNTIDFLAPQDSVVIETGLNGFSVGNVIYIECSYVPDCVSELNNHLLSFSTVLDGLHFSKATVNDSLLGFSLKYELDVPFGQAGFNASFVDIHSFSLPFTINNPLPVGIKVRSRINSVWDELYCRENSIETIEDISKNDMDSMYFKGDKIKDIFVERNKNNGFDDMRCHTIQISNSRILPSWDSQDSINSLHLSINAEVVVEGKMVTVENIERAGLQMGTPALSLKAIYGYYTYERRIDNPSEGIPILAQTSSSTDIVKNFRNRLIPDQTNLDLGIKFMLPDDTRFENVDLVCRLFERDSNEILDSMLFTMNDISAGKKYSNQVSFNRIIGRLPDSLRYSLTYIIKPYKKIYLDNDVISFYNNSFYADFDARADMTLTMYLVWGILDTISIEINQNTVAFPLSSKNIALMKSKELGLSVSIHNNSNISGRLRAVQTNCDWGNAENVYLLGDKGVVIPLRGNTMDNFISFCETDVRNLTNPDSLRVKWFIDLFPCEIDALKDTDFIEIIADLSLKGQHSTNSMFGLN